MTIFSIGGNRIFLGQVPADIQETGHEAEDAAAPLEEDARRFIKAAAAGRLQSEIPEAVLEFGRRLEQSGTDVTFSQIAFTTDNVERTLQELRQMGLQDRPYLRSFGRITAFDNQGNPLRFPRGALAMLSLTESVHFELPVSVPSGSKSKEWNSYCYAQREPKDRPKLSHFAFEVGSIDDASKRAEEIGSQLIQKGRVRDGTFFVDFAYYRYRGIVVELISPKNLALFPVSLNSSMISLAARKTLLQEDQEAGLLESVFRSAGY